MMIGSISIRNFRGLREISIAGLGRVTIVGGRNNCGKTSLLEAVYCVNTGAVASSIADLNGNRRMPLSWDDLSLAFSDGDTAREISICAETSESAVDLSIAMKDRGEQAYTGVAETDAKLAKLLEVKECERLSDGAEKNYLSRFYYVQRADPPVPGGLAEDGWVLDSPRQGKPKMVYLTSSVQRDVCSAFLRETLDRKQGGAIVSAMQGVDPRIRNLHVNGQVKADVDGVNHLLPVQVLGDGMQKIVNVLSSIYVCRGGGCVAIDEIDNGLHYSAYLSLLATATRFARENGVQLFMTTHNLEFLSRLCEEDEIRSLMEGDGGFAYLNLVRRSDNSIDCVRYSFDQLKDAIENGQEVR